MIFLFFSRISIYLLTVLLPLFHPGIMVSYDRIGIVLWFIVIPGEMIIAYFLSPPRLKFNHWILSALALIAAGVLYSCFIMSGLTVEALQILLFGSISFLLTISVQKCRWKILSIFELFFIGMIYYKLLNFSRSSEAIAMEHAWLTRTILVLCILIFLFHCFILYRFSFYNKHDRKRSKLEIFIFFPLTILSMLLITLLLPPDFISHSMVFNDLYEPIKKGKALTEEREEGPGLSSLPTDQWDRRYRKPENGKQYAVMIIASKHDPVYAAGTYLTIYNEKSGFSPQPDEALNVLHTEHLLDTWRNKKINTDRMRRFYDISFFSTLPTKVMPYYPVKIEPTILSRQYYPFSYRYNSGSKISIASNKMLEDSGDISAAEKEELAAFLEIPLSRENKIKYTAYLNKLKLYNKSIYEKVILLLDNFETYRYKIGTSEDMGIDKISDFLFTSKVGDCSEFSNSFVILSRLAGVPSRLVLGYVASKELQTNDHKKGLWYLRESIKPIKEFPLEDLYLVTTAHRHSWAQVYFPEYGWIDIETTATSIPPFAEFDPNKMGIVIPEITMIDQTKKRSFYFPWRLMIIFILLLSSSALIFLYSFKTIKIIYLSYASKSHSLKGLKALFRILQIRLTHRGYPPKFLHQTAKEYSKTFDQHIVKEFSKIYTELRYNEAMEKSKEENLQGEIRKQYKIIISKTRPKNIFAKLKGLLSLRGLFY